MIEEFDQRLMRLRQLANLLSDLEARLPGAVREVLWIIDETQEQRTDAVRALKHQREEGEKA